ncbi:bZIP transcription factor [Stagonosporopsis vannaccii]|nr:bZIP transcription factor [Stagonosporopsis vannaccii]
MSTVVLEMQSLGHHRRNIDLDFDMMSKTAPIYSTSDHWTTSSQEDHPFMSTPEYTGFPLTSTQRSDNPFTLSSNFAPSNSEHHSFHNKPGSEPSFNDYKTRPSISAPLEVNTSGMYSSPSIFTASNAQMSAHDPATISPLDTRFDTDYASPGSETKPSFESRLRNIPPSTYETYAKEFNPSSSKHRCDSLQSNFESQSSAMPQAQVGRRRGSEYAEPGSARAVYLEKNRKAASKCRSKQKRQQEELVETARDVERRNKILRAEVEILKSDMRDLMELVGQHSNCPDARLRLYVQREADRLAHQGSSRSSPLSGGSFSDPSSAGKVSSPEND